MLGNTRLVNHGIQTYQSDMMVHVSFATGMAYVYKTQEGVKAIKSGKYQTKPAYTGNIQTANGYTIPPDDISGCYSIEIPRQLLSELNCKQSDTTTEKGRKAVEVTKELLKSGAIHIPLSLNEITDRTMQINGLDITVSAKVHIQVKCDYRAGDRKLGGTGNLYLQVSECNPHSLH